MRIQVGSSEMNRIMKTIGRCVDTRDIGGLGNVEISHDNNLLTFRSSNGTFTAEMSTPMLGGDGEKFCVDAGVLGKVCALCSGEITLETTENACIVKGAGRTRLPMVTAKIPKLKEIDGQHCFVKAEDLKYAYNGVAHAISTNVAQVVLNGVHTAVLPEGLQLTALDGFQMAREVVNCDGDEMSMVIPGTFMRLIVDSTFDGETVTLISDGHRIQAETDGMKITCGLLANTFPAIDGKLPTEFATEVLLDAAQIKSVLKAGNVINNTNKTVKIIVEENRVTVKNNSEHADYEAVLECSTTGAPITLAFNQQYILNAINSINAEEIVMKMNTRVSPVKITAKQERGFRVTSPVRTQG